MENKQYCLYKHISPNGKMYIGITSNPTYKRWWRGKGYKDNSYFTAAINKYGWDSFEHIIVRTGLTKEEAEIAEITMIRHYKTRNKKYGYNISKGGLISSKTVEGRKRISEASTGRPNKNRGTCYYKKEYKKEINEEQVEKYINSNVLKKQVRCIETGIVYRSVREVERQLHLCHSGIARCCNGVPKYKTYGGYHWEYVS